MLSTICPSILNKCWKNSLSKMEWWLLNTEQLRTLFLHLIHLITGYLSL